MKFAAIKFLACIAFAGILLSSCSKFGLEVSHRKYRPGYHISWSGQGNHHDVKIAKIEVDNVPVKIIPKKEANGIIHEVKPVEMKSTGIEITSKHIQKTERGKAMREGESKSCAKVMRTLKSQNASIPETQKKDGKIFYWLSGLTALLATGITAAQRKRLTKISRWSAKNPALSRWIQVGGHLFLATAAFIAGRLLYMQDVITGPAMIPISSSAFLLAAMLYRGGKKRAPITPGYFMKAKMADLALILSSTMFLASVGNHITAAACSSHNNYGISSSASWQNLSSASDADEQVNESFSRSEHTERDYTGLRVFGMIMVIIGFVLTIIFLALLSCSIYCSGNVPVAFLLFFIGLSLFIYAMIKSIKAILAREKIQVK